MKQQILEEELREVYKTLAEIERELMAITNKLWKLRGKSRAQERRKANLWEANQ